MDTEIISQNPNWSDQSKERLFKIIEFSEIFKNQESSEYLFCTFQDFKDKKFFRRRIFLRKYRYNFETNHYISGFLLKYNNDEFIALKNESVDVAYLQRGIFIDGTNSYECSVLGISPTYTNYLNDEYFSIQIERKNDGKKFNRKVFVDKNISFEIGEIKLLYFGCIDESEFIVFVNETIYNAKKCITLPHQLLVEQWAAAYNTLEKTLNKSELSLEILRLMNMDAYKSEMDPMQVNGKIEILQVNEKLIFLKEILLRIGISLNYAYLEYSLVSDELIFDVPKLDSKFLSYLRALIVTDYLFTKSTMGMYGRLLNVAKGNLYFEI